MIDQVLQLDSNNAKALCRKLQSLVEMSQFEEARIELKQLKQKMTTKVWNEDELKLVKGVCQNLDKEIDKQDSKAKEFSKNIFSQGGLYADKPDVEEEKELTTEELLIIERNEETEYLATLSNFHWFVYPFFKTIEVACEKVFGCKSRAQKEN